MQQSFSIVNYSILIDIILSYLETKLNTTSTIFVNNIFI